MTRTTRAQLDALCNIINHALLCEPGTPCTALDPERAYRIEYAYGRPRLVRAGGSVDVSPRLPAGELAQWLRAFIDGIDYGRRRYERPAVRILDRDPDGFTAIIGGPS